MRGKISPVGGKKATEDEVQRFCGCSRAYQSNPKQERNAKLSASSSPFTSFQLEMEPMKRQLLATCNGLQTMAEQPTDALAALGTLLSDGVLLK